MSEYGGDFITITDEEGNEFELEHLDTLEHDGEVYMSFTVADTPEDAEEIDIIILKVEEDENGEEWLATVDDDNELDHVYELFMRRIEEMDEEGDGDTLLS